MPVTTIDFGYGGIREVGDHRVYTRAHWNETWQRIDHLQCLEAVWCCAPTLPTATLAWRYGSISQIDEPGFIWYAKKSNVSRLFVKIEIDMYREYEWHEWQTKTWYGAIDLNDDTLWGARDAAGAFSSGEQLFTAYGLEKLLADHWILHSYFDGSTTKTARALTFNDGGHANRSLSKDGSYVFASDPDWSEHWSSADVVEYLLALQTPRDNGDAIRIPFALDSAHNIPTWDRPELAQEGQTTYSLIERVINRKRLLLWWLEVESPEEEEDPDNVVLHTETLVARDVIVPLPGASAIPANAHQKRLLFNQDQLTVAVLRDDSVQRYDQVVCRGARRRSVGSFSVTDATIEPGWVAADETAYEEGASGSAGYAGLGTKEKQKKNRDARDVPKLERVFSFFRLPTTWNKKVKNGEGGDANPLFPAADGGAAGEPIYFPTLAFEQSLPLIKGIDYSGDAVKNGTYEEPKRDREELSSLVFLKRQETRYDTTVRWVDAETLADTLTAEESNSDANNRFSASVRVPPDSRGVFVRVHGGVGQHAIATADFTRLPVDEHPGGYNFRDGMILTLSLPDDRHVEGVWPATPPANVDAIRKLVIDAGDGYRKDYVAPGTVVGAKNDGSLLRSTGGHIPKVSPDDDEARLKALAKIAAAWYCVTHFVLRLETKRLRTDIAIGDLVTEIGDPAAVNGHHHVINSPVTEIGVRIPRDGGDPVMLVLTWAGELDPLQIMPVAPRSKLTPPYLAASAASSGSLHQRNPRNPG
jgi:hypothetical protein